MLASVIIVAALLFVIAVAVLMDACRPTLSLRLEQNTPARETPGARSSGCRLSEEDRDGFCQVWHSVREEFKEDPNTAVRRADLLLLDLIEDSTARPVDEEKPAGIFAGAEMEQEFWRAHEIALRSKYGLAKAAELSRAIRKYGELFERLLESDERANAVGPSVGRQS